MLQFLLRRLHARREQGAPRPYLRLHELPAWIRVAQDIGAAVGLMNDTNFGHPNRFKDRVFVEIQDAMATTTCPTKKLFIAMGVRFRQSPRKLASNLAAARPTKWPAALVGL
ncbi:unnamed protein product [Prorocentrum cordatum]|uniref:Alkyl-DHAP synthase n=1 Tax=Prorocentrum cordatum TaxID=2364126 RepID=A0ABN9WDG2_9DINO|nr:unnamed protein product [Polarella glacialis]